MQVPNLKWVVLALGRNDAANKEPLDATRKGLTSAIEAFLEKGVNVLLCGFRQAPTDDLAYAAGFSSLYPELARAYRLPFVTNLMANVEGVAAMNLNDGNHPNKEGQKQIAQNILDVLLPALKAAQTNEVPAKAGPPPRTVPEGTVAPQIQF
jgi:acyl-CoA thioesterase-1